MAHRSWYCPTWQGDGLQKPEVAYDITAAVRKERAMNDWAPLTLLTYGPESRPGEMVGLPTSTKPTNSILMGMTRGQSNQGSP